MSHYGAQIDAIDTFQTNKRQRTSLDPTTDTKSTHAHDNFKQQCTLSSGILLKPLFEWLLEQPHSAVSLYSSPQTLSAERKIQDAVTIVGLFELINNIFDHGAMSLGHQSQLTKLANQLHTLSIRVVHDCFHDILSKYFTIISSNILNIILYFDLIVFSPQVQLQHGPNGYICTGKTDQTEDGLNLQQDNTNSTQTLSTKDIDAYLSLQSELITLIPLTETHLINKIQNYDTFVNIDELDLDRNENGDNIVIKHLPTSRCIHNNNSIINVAPLFTSESLPFTNPILTQSINIIRPSFTSLLQPLPKKYFNLIQSNDQHDSLDNDHNFNTTNSTYDIDVKPQNQNQNQNTHTNTTAEKIHSSKALTIPFPMYSLILTMYLWFQQTSAIICAQIDDTNIFKFDILSIHSKLFHQITTKQNFISKDNTKQFFSQKWSNISLNNIICTIVRDHAISQLQIVIYKALHSSFTTTSFPTAFPPSYPSQLDHIKKETISNINNPNTNHSPNTRNEQIYNNNPQIALLPLPLSIESQCNSKMDLDNSDLSFSDINTHATPDSSTSHTPQSSSSSLTIYSQSLKTGQDYHIIHESLFEFGQWLSTTPLARLFLLHFQQKELYYLNCLTLSHQITETHVLPCSNDQPNSQNKSSSYQAENHSNASASARRSLGLTNLFSTLIRAITTPTQHRYGYKNQTITVTPLPYLNNIITRSTFMVITSLSRWLSIILVPYLCTDNELMTVFNFLLMLQNKTNKSNKCNSAQISNKDENNDNDTSAVQRLLTPTKIKHKMASNMNHDTNKTDIKKPNIYNLGKSDNNDDIDSAMDDTLSDYQSSNFFSDTSSISTNSYTGPKANKNNQDVDILDDLLHENNDVLLPSNGVFALYNLLSPWIINTLDPMTLNNPRIEYPSYISHQFEPHNQKNPTKDNINDNDAQDDDDDESIVHSLTMCYQPLSPFQFFYFTLTINSFLNPNDIDATPFSFLGPNMIDIISPIVPLLMKNTFSPLCSIFIPPNIQTISTLNTMNLILSNTPYNSNNIDVVTQFTQNMIVLKHLFLLSESIDNFTHIFMSYSLSSQLFPYISHNTNNGFVLSKVVDGNIDKSNILKFITQVNDNNDRPNNKTNSPSKKEKSKHFNNPDQIQSIPIESNIHELPSCKYIFSSIFGQVSYIIISNLLTSSFQPISSTNNEKSNHSIDLSDDINDSTSTTGDHGVDPSYAFLLLLSHIITFDSIVSYLHNNFIPVFDMSGNHSRNNDQIRINDAFLVPYHNVNTHNSNKKNNRNIPYHHHQKQTPPQQQHDKTYIAIATAHATALAARGQPFVQLPFPTSPLHSTSKNNTGDSKDTTMNMCNNSGDKYVEIYNENDIQYQFLPIVHDTFRLLDMFHQNYEVQWGGKDVNNTKEDNQGGFAISTSNTFVQVSHLHRIINSFSPITLAQLSAAHRRISVNQRHSIESMMMSKQINNGNINTNNSMSNNPSVDFNTKVPIMMVDPLQLFMQIGNFAQVQSFFALVSSIELSPTDPIIKNISPHLISSRVIGLSSFSTRLAVLCANVIDLVFKNHVNITTIKDLTYTTIKESNRNIDLSATTDSTTDTVSISAIRNMIIENIFAHIVTISDFDNDANITISNHQESNTKRLISSHKINKRYQHYHDYYYRSQNQQQCYITTLSWLIRKTLAVLYISNQFTQFALVHSQLVTQRVINLFSSTQLNIYRILSHYNQKNINTTPNTSESLSLLDIYSNAVKNKTSILSLEFSIFQQVKGFTPIQAISPLYTLLSDSFKPNSYEYVLMPYGYIQTRNYNRQDLDHNFSHVDPLWHKLDQSISFFTTNQQLPGITDGNNQYDFTDDLPTTTTTTTTTTKVIDTKNRTISPPTPNGLNNPSMMDDLNDVDYDTSISHIDGYDPGIDHGDDLLPTNLLLLIYCYVQLPTLSPSPSFGTTSASLPPQFYSSNTHKSPCLARFTPFNLGSWLLSRTSTDIFSPMITTSSLLSQSTLSPSSSTTTINSNSNDYDQGGHTSFPIQALVHLPLHYQRLVKQFTKEWHSKHIMTQIVYPLAYTTVTIRWYLNHPTQFSQRDPNLPSHSFNLPQSTLIPMSFPVYIVVNTIQLLYYSKLSAKRNCTDHINSGISDQGIVDTNITISAWEIMLHTIKILQPTVVMGILHTITSFDSHQSSHKTIGKESVDGKMSSKYLPTFLRLGDNNTGDNDNKNDILNIDQQNNNVISNSSHKMTPLQSFGAPMISICSIFIISPSFLTHNQHQNSTGLDDQYHNNGIDSDPDGVALLPVQPHINPNLANNNGTLYQMYSFYNQFINLDIFIHDEQEFINLLKDFDSKYNRSTTNSFDRHRTLLDYNCFIEIIFPHLDRIYNLTTLHNVQLDSLRSKLSSNHKNNNNTIDNTVKQPIVMNQFLTTLRKTSIRAFIMRYMKQNKSVLYNTLYDMVYNYITTQSFEGRYGQYKYAGMDVRDTTSNDDEIKLNIEYLLNDYELSRDDDDFRLIHYEA